MSCNCAVRAGKPVEMVEPFVIIVKRKDDVKEVYLVYATRRDIAKSRLIAELRDVYEIDAFPAERIGGISSGIYSLSLAGLLA